MATKNTEQTAKVEVAETPKADSLSLVEGTELPAAGGATGSVESEYELSAGLVQVNYV
jgi:hypothetical protein